MIGLVTLPGDLRYAQDWGDAWLIVPPSVRSIGGAKTVFKNFAFVSEAMGLAPRMETRREAGGDALPAKHESAEAGALFALLDLPGEMVKAVAAAAPNVTRINVSAPANALHEACLAGPLRSCPGVRDLMDAFARSLRSRHWTEVLMLEGESHRDAAIADGSTAHG
jgi:hypothetical protein